MSNTEQLIAANDKQPADVVVLKKKFISMVDHFTVYLGRDTNTGMPVFAANHSRGTEYVWDKSIDDFLMVLRPERIERFTGNNIQREQAVQRALSRIGESNYNYFTNNCEHYKNFVQTGIPFSQQVKNLGGVLALTAGAVVFGAILNEIFSDD